MVRRLRRMVHDPVPRAGGEPEPDEPVAFPGADRGRTHEVGRTGLSLRDSDGAKCPLTPPPVTFRCRPKADVRLSGSRTTCLVGEVVAVVATALEELRRKTIRLEIQGTGLHPRGA
jgi:hypothetical protein